MAGTLGAEFKSCGITADTPKNIMLGAGTIHKGLKFTTDKWNFEESLIGATSGGTTVTITPEFYDPEIDGALVKVKGLTQKVGETATMEINFAELTPDVINSVVVGETNSASSATGYTEVNSKARITEGDYYENIAYVGKKLDGTPIIIIFDNALCTSGLELAGTNKEMNVMTATFECYADITSGDFERLPWHIYYPTATA